MSMKILSGATTSKFIHKKVIGIKNSGKYFSPENETKLRFSNQLSANFAKYDMGSSSSSEDEDGSVVLDA
jgi:hypothetical protein